MQTSKASKQATQASRANKQSKQAKQAKESKPRKQAKQASKASKQSKQSKLYFFHVSGLVYRRYAVYTRERKEKLATRYVLGGCCGTEKSTAG